MRTIYYIPNNSYTKTFDLFNCWWKWHGLTKKVEEMLRVQHAVYIYVAGIEVSKGTYHLNLKYGLNIKPSAWLVQNWMTMSMTGEIYPKRYQNMGVKNTTICSQLFPTHNGANQVKNIISMFNFNFFFFGNKI